MAACEQRTSVMTIRLTPSERAGITTVAQILDVNASEYVRALLTLPVEIASDALSEKDLPVNKRHTFLVFDRATFRSLHRQLRAWGYHYNQAVHALNYIASKNYLPAEDTYEYLSRALDLMSDIDNYRAEIEKRLEVVESFELIKLGR